MYCRFHLQCYSIDFLVCVRILLIFDYQNNARLIERLILLNAVINNNDELLSLNKRFISDCLIKRVCTFCIPHNSNFTTILFLRIHPKEMLTMIAC